MSIQPVLTPCKGCLCDVTIQADPSDPDRLLLSWGLALILALPRDRNSLLFRVTAVLLAGMGLSLSSLEGCLGVTAKTLRSWLKDLREGKWQQHSALFHGPGASRMLSPEVERYVRVRNREAVGESGPGRAPYGFSTELRAELARYWGVELSGETLRLVFRGWSERRRRPLHRSRVRERGRRCGASRGGRLRIRVGAERGWRREPQCCYRPGPRCTCRGRRQAELEAA
jgi:transposase